MTTITFPRKEIEKQIKLTKETIEKISLFGTPLERINQEELEIEVFPNRPDLISMQGFLRGFKAFLGKTQIKKYKLEKPLRDYKVTIAPSVKNVRPYTACAIVKNLKFNDELIKEIIDLQEKLHLTIGRNRKKVAIGIYPLEKITLPIKYEARPPEKIKFVPLEETKEMTGTQILRKHPTGREYEHLLAYHDKFPIFIDAKNSILSMPPIINSEDTGKITNSTKEVFIECSGSHLETLQKTLNIIITTLADMGGSVFQMDLQYPDKKITTPNLESERMSISLENTNKLLGLDLKEQGLQKLLQKMGHEYKNHVVQIPAWRTDILHEVDLIEDIAIAYGYDKLQPEIPNISTTAEENKKEKTKTKIAEILIGLGLIETSSYHLIKQREAELMKIENKIELEDSKTDYKFLRPNLLIPTLRILTENKDHEYPQETFELGTVFSLDENEKTGIKETESLIIALSPGNFTKMKQVLDCLTSQLDIKYKLEPTINKNLIEGRTAIIKMGEISGETIRGRAGGSIPGKRDTHQARKVTGYLGELHPETLRAWGIKMPLTVLEISLDEIIKQSQQN